MPDVTLTVNGRTRTAPAQVRMTLADFLRDELDLTGTHLGCEHGVCGACTVLMDGRSVRACLLFAVQAQGHDILTVEGLVDRGGAGVIDGDALHPIQQAFHEEHALQCGFCTPGFLLSVKELLGSNPDPNDEEIRTWLSGNLCRCTGYQNIVAAVHRAAARMRGAL